MGTMAGEGSVGTMAGEGSVGRGGQRGQGRAAWAVDRGGEWTPK